MNKSYYEDISRQVMPYAPNCPEPVLIENVRQAVMEFLRVTRLWRISEKVETNDIDCFAGCIPSGAVILDYLSVVFDGCRLEPIAYGELIRKYPDWFSDDEKNKGVPKYVSQENINGLIIYPRAEGTLHVTATLIPSNDSDTAPSWVFDNHSRLIAAGALKDILLLPSQPFFNPDLAASFSSRFYAGLSSLQGNEVKGQQRAILRTKSQFM